MSIIWWLNTAVAKVISRLLRGPVGIIVHFFAMGYVYSGALTLAYRVLYHLPFPTPNLTQAELQAMSQQEIFALISRTPSIMVALGVMVVAIGSAFVLQIVGTFKAAKIYNGNVATARSAGKMRSGINKIDTLPSEDFEQFLGLFFKGQGYQSKQIQNKPLEQV